MHSINTNKKLLHGYFWHRMFPGNIHSRESRAPFSLPRKGCCTPRGCAGHHGTRVLPFLDEAFQNIWFLAP